MTKQELLKMVEDLPEETSPENLGKVADVLEKIRFLESVNRGLEQAERGEGTPHEEFVARFERRFQR